MTAIDNVPFLITSESFFDDKGQALATLMLASPLDDEFLISSQGSSTGKNIVTLLIGENQSILATNQPHLLKSGTDLASRREDYIATGKSFFDYGSSDLVLQFASFIPISEFESIIQDLITRERQKNAISGLVFIASFGIVMSLIAYRIQRVTRSIDDFSQKVFGIEHRPFRGDQLYILEERFKSLSEEVIASRETMRRNAAALQRSRDELEIRVDERTLELQGLNRQLMDEIRERKKVEEDLRIKDSAIDSSINAIAIADMKIRLTYVNQSFLRLWGYDHEAEVLGRKATEFWKEFSRARTVVEELNYQGSWVGELIALRKDGTELTVQLLINMVRDDQRRPICIMGSFVDITERIKAEERIEVNYHIQHVISSLLRIALEVISIEERLERTLELILSLPWFAVQSKGGIDPPL